MTVRTLWDHRRRRSLRDVLSEGFDGEAFLRDVIGARDPFRKGDEVWTSCPLPYGMHAHGDNTASFSLNEEKLVASCFVCGGGDILWLTQTVLGVDVDQAMRLIRTVARTTQDLDGMEFLRMLKSVLTPGEEPSIELPRLSEAILKPWRHYSVYLDGRGVSREVQRTMQTGIDYRHREEDREGRWHEQVRLVLPHFWEGKLVGWQKRRLISQDVGPKYHSSSGAWRSRTLYGWDQVQGREEITIVESPASVLRMLTDDWPNPVASFGSRVTDLQVALLHRFDRVLLFFDGGPAGRMATSRVADRLDDVNDVRAVLLPMERDGWDPGDMQADQRLEWASRSVEASRIDRRWSHGDSQAVHGRTRRKGARRAGVRR